MKDSGRDQAPEKGAHIYELSHIWRKMSNIDINDEMDAGKRWHCVAYRAAPLRTALNRMPWSVKLARDHASIACHAIDRYLHRITWHDVAWYRASMASARTWRPFPTAAPKYRYITPDGSITYSSCFFCSTSYLPHAAQHNTTQPNTTHHDGTQNNPHKGTPGTPKHATTEDKSRQSKTRQYRTN